MRETCLRGLSPTCVYLSCFHLVIRKCHEEVFRKDTLGFRSCVFCASYALCYFWIHNPLILAFTANLNCRSWGHDNKLKGAEAEFSGRLFISEKGRKYKLSDAIIINALAGRSTWLDLYTRLPWSKVGHLPVTPVTGITCQASPSNM